MFPRFSGQTSIFGVVFFVSTSLLGIEFTILTRKPLSHVRIFISSFAYCVAISSSLPGSHSFFGRSLQTALRCF